MMARIKICKEPGCKDAASTEGYCRLHYLMHWKRIRKAKKIAAARKLNRYIEHICKENPDDYMEVIRKDLRSSKFPEYVDEAFGESEGELVFEEGQGEEDIDRIIKKLKIEEGF